MNGDFADDAVPDTSVAYAAENNFAGDAAVSDVGGEKVGMSKQTNAWH